MNDGKSSSTAAGSASGWTRRRWLTMLAIVFAVQVALIFALGEKRFPSPVTVINAPQLTLVDGTSDMIALGDPTLFALPHAEDFAPAYWGQMPVTPPASFPRTEPVLPPLLVAEDLGAMFIRFMQTNVFASPQNDFKPAPRLSEPDFTVKPALPENSTLQITGDLAQRPLLHELNLPTLTANDVIAPSRVQVFVDPAGSVFSAVLMPPDNQMEAPGRTEAGDAKALQIAGSLKFAPAAHLTVGLLIFHWRTIAPPATNSAAAAP